VSEILASSAWIAISRPLLAGYGYPARANSPKILDAPILDPIVEEISTYVIILTVR
jgi:hypothetical protein